MFTEIKRLFKHSIIYGIGHFLTRLVGFALLPLYSNILSTEKFGDYTLIFMFMGFANVLYIYGFDSALMRFYLLEKDDEERKKIFTTTLIPLFFTSLVFSVLVFCYSEILSVIIFESPKYFRFFYWASGILFFDTLSVLGFLILRAQERSILFITIRLINVIITVSLNIILVAYFKIGVYGILISNVTASFLTLVMLIPVIISQISFVFSYKYFKELLSFGLPYIIPGISLISMELIGRFFILKFIGKSEVGIFSASYKLAMAVFLVIAAYRFAWQPFFLSVSRDDNAKELYARILTYFLLFIAWLYLLISFFVRDIVEGLHFLGPDYWAGVKIVPIIMLAYVFYGIYVNLIAGIYIKKKSVYLPYITGAGALANIALNILFIPVYGLIGAAVASAVSYCIMAGLMFIVTHKIYPVQYEYVRITKIVIITSFCFFIGYWGYQPMQPYLKIVLFVFFPFILKIVGFFDKEEITRLKEKIHFISNSKNSG